MRRAHLVFAGTIAGTVAALVFPVESSHVDALGPGTATSPGGGSGSTGVGSSGPSAAPTTTAPSSSSPSSSPTTSAPPTTTTNGTRSATGTEEQYPYGQLAVAVTVQGGKISNVSLANISETDPRSARIDSQAVPQLEQQVISADSANIDGISGATYTSEAFARSLASALGQLGFK